MAIRYPVIVVPGITASYLRDVYPLPPEFVWTVLGKEYDRAALHPDDLRYEAREPARVKADQLFEIAYQELVEELRYNLKQHEDEPVPVYPFGYDWRQPLDRIEAELAALVTEVIERTKLMPHYHRAGYGDDAKVNLVGHSMGGLVIAGYLQRAGPGAPVHKVATLATPFQGSFEAVIKVITGTANLGVSAPSSREREAARMTPALYHLMPSFANGIEPSDVSLFDAARWQASVIETIAEYIRLRGIAPPRQKSKLRARAGEVFEAMLEGACAHRSRVDGFKLEQAGLGPDDWLCVAGVDAVTRVRLKVQKRPAQFVLSSSDRQNFWDLERGQLDDAIEAGFLTQAKARDETFDLTPLRRFTGDGTVPFEGALPNFLPLEKVVCVTPDDYGYWELEDRGLTRLGGFHGILPNMNMLHRLLVRFFIDGKDDRGNTWGHPAPGISADAWNPPLRLDPKS